MSPPDETTPVPTGAGAKVAAWLVHLYTALGAVIAFMALRAINEGEIREAFLWLCASLFIDATDGALARLAQVKKVVPHFDGSKLDDIVDYVTFVLVPFVLMWATGILSGDLGLVACSAALLASAYRFCHESAKTPDHYFTGFPSYWNILAFYLYVFAFPPAVAAGIVLFLAALVFAPIEFLYPSRNPWMQRSTILFGSIWAVVAMVIIWQMPQRAVELATVSLVYPAFYTGASIYGQLQRRGALGGT